MVPIIVAIKVLKELGLIDYLAVPLTPIMELVGLPSQTGLVWAASIANGLYSGILVYTALIPDMPTISVAQITVLATILLIAHNIPVEVRITQQCGVGIWSQLVLRFGGALICGVMLHLIFSRWNLLSEPAVILWQVKAPADPSWLTWAMGEGRNLLSIFVIIFILMTVMRLLNYFHITDLFNRLLQPILRLMGIGKEAATITIIGLTMGIAYGGGLIIHEAHRGKMKQHDIFAAVSLMGLSHALIEDSLLMSLLGASLYGILFARLLFSLVVVAGLTRFVARLGNRGG
ncbi:MAG: hypothetical protein HQK55_01350 [Deltaproteobacteria bacterium]|nr:hypothetical protein [Deltaproteobacteria bacterium]